MRFLAIVQTLLICSTVGSSSTEDAPPPPPHHHQTIFYDESADELPILGQQSVLRTKVAKKSNVNASASVGDGAYYFVAHSNHDPRKPILKNRIDVPERTKKRVKIKGETRPKVEDSGSTKEAAPSVLRIGNGRDKKSMEKDKDKKGKGKGKGKEVDCKGGETISPYPTSSPTASASPAPTESAFPSALQRGKSGMGGMGGMAGMGGKGGMGERGKGMGGQEPKGKGMGKGMSGKSKKECIPTPSANPLSTYLPSDLPSMFGPGSTQPSGLNPRPTPVPVPPVVSPIISPPVLVVPTPVVISPPVNVPIGPDAVTEAPTVFGDTNAPSLEQTAPGTELPTSLGSGTLAPSLAIMTESPTPAATISTTTQAPAVMTATPSPMAPVAGNVVPATPFSVTYTTNSGATPVQLEEAAAITLDYLETYIISQFDLSTATVLDDFMGMLTGSNAGTSTALFDASAIFSEASTFLPSTVDVDALMQAAFSPPLVIGLLTALATELSPSNPLSGTTEVTYSRSRRRGKRRRLWSSSSRA
jgi:hypothetical protein